MSIDKSNPIKGVALRLDTDTAVGSKGEVIYLTQGRHCQLFQKREGCGKVLHTQGFVLKDNTFVTRVEAFDIITKNKIKILSKSSVGKMLFSEDLW